jgi:hypothetical protein
MTVSASLHKSTVEAIRSRVGKRGFSRYVEGAVLRQIEQDNLREVLDDFESVNGPADQQAVSEWSMLLRGEATGQAGAA